ncbi:MAG: alpha/beta fold hydrolase [Bacteroidota bacterium]
MPLINQSSYTSRPWLHFSPYLETLIPYFNMSYDKPQVESEKLELSDGDFLELEWIRGHSSHLLVFTHGFEGNTQDAFMVKSAKYFSMHGFDVLLWNLRSCGKALNRNLELYHYGSIQDLHAVVSHGIGSGGYDQVSLIGFSLGGGITINYLGSGLVPEEVKSSVCISTPLSIYNAAAEMGSGWNRYIIEKKFLAKIKRKLIKKAGQFPAHLKVEEVLKANSLRALFEDILLPLYGYESVGDYRQKWDCRHFLPKISCPFLLINALNDPLLSSVDFPTKVFTQHNNLFLEMPALGGHVGFSGGVGKTPWYIQRVQEFINEWKEVGEGSDLTTSSCISC